MKSLRELRAELTGVRLAAVDTSIWSLVTTIDERARVAINDAIRVYNFPIEVMYNSIPTITETYGFPKSVDGIISLERIRSDGSKVPITHFNFIPTATTNLLQINVTGTSALGESYVVRANERLPEFPPEGVLIGGLTATATVVEVTNVIPVSVYPVEGYIEIYAGDNTREICKYDARTSTSFQQVTRGIVGEAIPWASGVSISPVAPIPLDSAAVILQAAQANMYEYWMGHRAMYDQYSAIAGVNQLSMEDLSNLIALYDQRAERRYRRVKTLPAPARMRRG